MTDAESFNRRDGKLSTPTDLEHLSDFRILCTSETDTSRNLKIPSVLLAISLVTLQVRLDNGKAFCFKQDTILVKYLQKAFEISTASVKG